MTSTQLDDLLYIGTLVTNCLLGHLETTWSELCCPHFLSAVTLSLARGFFGYRFVAYNLHNSTGLENIITYTQVSGITSYGWTGWCNTVKCPTTSTKALFTKPRQSSQSTPPREWPPGLVWCRFLSGCFCPAAVGCLQTWSQSHQRSFNRTQSESIKISHWNL